MCGCLPIMSTPYTMTSKALIIRIRGRLVRLILEASLGFEDGLVDGGTPIVEFEGDDGGVGARLGLPIGVLARGPLAVLGASRSIFGQFAGEIVRLIFVEYMELAPTRHCVGVLVSSSQHSEVVGIFESETPLKQVSVPFASGTITPFA